MNYAIVERIRHPDYRPPGKYNDIALLKLDRRVQFNDFIRPACLYTSNHFTVSKTVATGWGRIDFGKTSEKGSMDNTKIGIKSVFA